MNDLRVMDFEDTPVRTLVGEDGELLWVGVDVCRALGIANARDAIAGLDEDERVSVGITDGNPGNPNHTLITESGLYALIFKSRKPAAKRFKKWVRSVVLPSIRKTGRFEIAPPPPPQPAALAPSPTELAYLLIKSEAEKAALAVEVAALEGKVEVLGPESEAFRRLADADGTFGLRQSAKALQVREREHFAWMREHKWIYRSGGTGPWQAYADRIASGDLVQKVTTVRRPDESEKVVAQVFVTAQGLAKLAAKLGRPDPRSTDLVIS